MKCDVVNEIVFVGRLSVHWSCWHRGLRKGGGWERYLCSITTIPQPTNRFDLISSKLTNAIPGLISLLAMAVSFGKIILNYNEFPTLSSIHKQISSSSVHLCFTNCFFSWDANAIRWTFRMVARGECVIVLLRSTKAKTPRIRTVETSSKYF